MFYVQGVSQIVNFNREEIEKVVKKLQEKEMKLSLKSGHHFRRKDCYDTLKQTGEREVFAISIDTQTHLGKRSRISDGKDTHGKKDKKEMNTENTYTAEDERRRRIKEEKRKQSQRNVHYTTGYIESSDQL